MASLTHVCMWSDNGWKRITAEQAARLHPGGTVSAHSGLFMCELCGQYVILTDGDIRIRYFKHSAYEKSKDCPERTFGAGYSISYGSQEHDLPIRITNVSSSSFSFEVGLIRAPISSLGKDFCIEIKPKGAFDIPYVYTKERLNYDSITYLPIGERPFEKYTLSFQNGNDKLREFWPAEIKGIDPEGTLFEKVSGKKLSYDADVEIGKEYYLLKRGYIYRKSFSSVRIQEIMQKRIGWETWSLYVVSASAFNEDAARFYLDFHCRLTDHPVSLQPVCNPDNLCWTQSLDSVRFFRGQGFVGSAVVLFRIVQSSLPFCSSAISSARFFSDKTCFPSSFVSPCRGRSGKANTPVLH